MHKPNILLIMCDQLRYDCLTSSYIKTPNIDRIKEKGVFFNNAYSQTPVCIPARHSLIAGQNAFSIGLPENMVKRGEIKYPLPELVRNQGYYTCAVGKMHFIPTREHFGFDKMLLSEEMPGHIEDDEYLQFLRDNGYQNVIEPHGKRSETYYIPQDSELPKDFHTTAWTARTTKKVIENNLNRNFFIFSSFIKPHPPFDPCEPFNSMYDPNSVPEPIRHNGDTSPLDSSIYIQNGYKVNGISNVTDEHLKKMRAYYYASVTQVDTYIGEILDTLETNGIYDDTLIILTADHGEMLGDHAGFGKRTYYEQSTKIPYIISYPKEFEQGVESNALVTLQDIYATILTCCGAEVPNICDGLDLTAVCKAQKENVRETLIAEYGTGREFKCMLRWENYKYIYFANGGNEVLYDLDKDPNEINPTNNEIFKWCKNVLVKYYKSYSYDEALNNGELIKFDYEKPIVGSYINQYPSWQNK